MNKAILLSIKPNWVAKILNGEKTIEIRKRLIPVGTKVYIYVTKNGLILQIDRTNNFCRLWKEKNNRLNCDYLNGKVVASFIVDKCEKCEMQMCLYNQHSIYINNKYVGELESCKLELLEKSCITSEELYKYLSNDFDEKIFYAWHISQLKIFDKPKELGEFGIPQKPYKNGNYEVKILTKAPQSFMYVEEAK